MCMSWGGGGGRRGEAKFKYKFGLNEIDFMNVHKNTQQFAVISVQSVQDCVFVYVYLLSVAINLSTRAAAGWQRDAEMEIISKSLVTRVTRTAAADD